MLAYVPFAQLVQLVWAALACLPAAHSSHAAAPLQLAAGLACLVGDPLLESEDVDAGAVAAAAITPAVAVHEYLRGQGGGRPLGVALDVDAVRERRGAAEGPTSAAFALVLHATHTCYLTRT